jgi:uncharacterized repeat protein (TIGR03803 family)
MKKLLFLCCSILILATGTVKAQIRDLLNFNDTNGASPYGDVIISGNKLFGMTYSGGEYNYGVIFSMDTNGNRYKVLLNFNDTNGQNPYGALTLSGNILYGMTYYGGAWGNGLVFSIDTNGSGYKDLLDFHINSGSAGADPVGSLTLSGNVLFGMTYFGGGFGDGLLFSINTNGSRYKDILDFNGANGEYPYGNVILSGSRLYGMTLNGGAHSNGLIFSIDTNGSEYKDLLDFNSANGKYPHGSLCLSGKQLFGMTISGGTDSEGVVFSIDTNGSMYKVLLNFNTSNGQTPYGSLILSGKVLYGMTSTGGANTGGNIFSIDTSGSGYKDMYDCDITQIMNGVYPYGSLCLSGNSLYGMTTQGGLWAEGVIFKMDTNTVAGINELSVNSGVIALFPNPNNGNFTLYLQGISGKSQITVYNLLGEQVLQTSLNSTTTQIDMSNKAEGLYLYRIVTIKGELIGEGKFVIQ